MHRLNRQQAPHQQAPRAAPVDRASGRSAAASGTIDLASPLRDWVIPRLAERHRGDPGSPVPGGRWLASLAVHDDPDALQQAVEQLQHQGVDAETLQLDWLAGAAHELGRRWGEDECSFSDVTVGLVRLQCVMRRLNRDAAEPPAATDGAATQRILLMLAPGEQHSFGLSLVAEAFRRARWDVCCVHGPDGPAPAERLARSAYDLVGVSVGSTARAAGLRDLCARLRQASCRPGLGVLLGGPFFATLAVPAEPPDWGADAIALDARAAVVAACRLLAASRARDPAALTLAAVG